MKDALATLAAGQPLQASVMEAAVGTIMDGEATPAQIGAFLAALRVKGESVEELVAAVRVMRSRCLRVRFPGPLLDTCGTGGDGLGTFNISTAVSFVAAAAGAKVAKHGNRAASGKVGAADVLEALGARIDLGPVEAARALEEVGIAFLFAPLYHPAMRHVAPVRRELGFRTLFNLTGPLCNPAGATHQLVGLFDPAWMQPMAQALAQLGAHRAMVVHGSDGSDEITLTGPSSVVELRDGEITAYRLDPESFGLDRCSAADLRGGDAGRNAELVRAVLSGATGPAADVVALNAAAALYVAGHSASLAEGLGAARDLMASGAAAAKLDAFVAFTSAVGA